MSSSTSSNKKPCPSSLIVMESPIQRIGTFDIQVNDYVKWDTKYHPLEGWVYFVDEEYITIEVGVKPKKHCNYSRNMLHCKDHILVVCHSYYWNQLQYIKSRESNHETANTFVRTITDDSPSSYGST